MSEQINKMEKIEKDLYVKAYLGGHSVLAISRLLGFDNAGRVYKVLRDVGVVPKLPKSQKFSLPIVLEATFCKTKLSFAQWCNSWELDIRIAEKAINLGPWETKDPQHREVLSALRSDFNNLYLDLYQIGNELDRKYPSDRADRPKYSLNISWSDEVNGYIAVIPELPKINGVGLTWDAALAEVKYLYNVCRRILKLENLINNNQ